MFRGTCSSIEMLKGYMARESLGTPALGAVMEKAKPLIQSFSVSEGP